MPGHVFLQEGVREQLLQPAMFDFELLEALRVGHSRTLPETRIPSPIGSSGSTDVHLIFLPVDPRWDDYRSDPRFRAVVTAGGFTQTAV